MRDPHQVFTLLESIFQAFDSLAKKRGVYKVETIGDCYVGEFFEKGADEPLVKSKFLSLSLFIAQLYVGFLSQIWSTRLTWLGLQWLR
jgi:Adenylate and Guanylate cyclase catalytic domain